MYRNVHAKNLPSCVFSLGQNLEFSDFLKKPLNANNGNVYRDDGIIFGMHVHIIQIQILRAKFICKSLLTRSLCMKGIKSSKKM